MGYDLHITRAKYHFENEECQISAEEWLQIVEADSELRLAGYNGEYFTLWDGESEDPDPWLDWFEGNVHTKNPGDALIDKMVDLAKKLDAKVQGDDGEIYVGGGREGFVPEPDHESSAPGPRKNWLQRLLGR